MKHKAEGKKLNPVQRLIHSMESRLKTYNKNKARIESEFREALAKEDRKIADVKLQIAALKSNA